MAVQVTVLNPALYAESEAPTSVDTYSGGQTYEADIDGTLYVYAAPAAPIALYAKGTWQKAVNS